MMQGVLVNGRVRLLLNKVHPCYRPRRKGERKKKSVRGCIVGPDLAVLSLIIVKKGHNELPGLTDVVIPRRLGPKRASKIRKLFRLTKKDDVRKYVKTYRRLVIRKPKEGKEQKPKLDKDGNPKPPKLQGWKSTSTKITKRIQMPKNSKTCNSHPNPKETTTSFPKEKENCQV